jgi:hypothetical protein
MAGRKPSSAVQKGRALQQQILDEASKVFEDTKRVRQLGLPIPMDTKADQMLMPGFDVGGVLDPRRTWRPR